MEKKANEMNQASIVLRTENDRLEYLLSVRLIKTANDASCCCCSNKVLHAHVCVSSKEGSRTENFVPLFTFNQNISTTVMMTRSCLIVSQR